MFGVDESGRVTFVTEAFASRLGTTREALAGRSLTDLVVGDGEAVQATLAAVADADAGATRRCRVSFDPETAAPATVEFTATDGGVVGTLCQRTAPTDEFHHLFAQSHDAIVAFEMVNKVPVVRRVNDAFIETFGYAEGEIVGESLNDYIVPDGRVSEATDYDQRTAAGKVNHAIVARKTVDGRREFLYRGLPYETDAGRRYGFAIYTDVTDDRRRQRRLRVLHRVLRHNLGNDLSVVFGMAEYLQQNVTRPELQTAAVRILDAAERLDDVSEQAREVEAALDTVTERSVDAAALACSVADDYRHRTPLQTMVPETAPVSGGFNLVGALENLVENAVEHTPDGTPVRLTVDAGEEDTLIRVADDGDGIPAIERAPIFEDADITTLQHGTGLGLWFARWVAEAAGGDLRYDRTDGWTVVTLRLPSAETCDFNVSDRCHSPPGR
ncbi:PAS domain-containing sensor histidine kinase [Haloarcula marina]|uniref:PAS domain-containing sensor histidine kinase n=1 Tax=Haloarcula marina TaxID=2961574 RepID=UPI0020B680A4|nr:ATP-binding protein [Halomicroarcula marina]